MESCFHFEQVDRNARDQAAATTNPMDWLRGSLAKLWKEFARVGLLLALAVCPAAGQDPPAPPARPDLDPDPRIIAARKISTMQRDLDRLAAAGYRLISSASPGTKTEWAIGNESWEIEPWRIVGDELKAVMVRVTEPPDTYSYKVLATRRPATLQKEINQLAARGYRLIPGTVVGKEQVMGMGPELVAIMEKAPGSQPLYTYVVLATNRESTMQKEINETRAKGYTLVRILAFQEIVAVLEKPAGN